MTSAFCRYTNCDRPLYGRMSTCKYHYELERIASAPVCRFIGCDNHQSCKGYCKYHYERQLFLKRNPEYKIWVGLRQRCNNRRAGNYGRYGARGIRVCPRWDSYENFISDMGARPTKKHSIERIDTFGDYSPENCRWATVAEQAVNKRMRSDNTSGYPGVTWSLQRGKWQALIVRSGKKQHLGFFSDLSKAIEARKEAEVTAVSLMAGFNVTKPQ